MNEPIGAGDRCEVIDGLKGKDSPNLGLVVRALAYIGDHSKLGRMWRCEAEYASIGHQGANTTCPPGQADFAQTWLRKLPPPEPKTVKDEIREHTA